MAVEIDYRRSSKTPQLNYPDVAQFGRAPALGAGCRMFKSCHLDQYSSIVQSVERWTVNPYVTGSSPVRGAIMREWRNWHTLQTQNLVIAISCGFDSHLSHHYVGCGEMANALDCGSSYCRFKSCQPPQDSLYISTFTW